MSLAHDRKTGAADGSSPGPNEKIRRLFKTPLARDRNHPANDNRYPLDIRKIANWALPAVSAALAFAAILWSVL